MSYWLGQSFDSLCNKSSDFTCPFGTHSLRYRSFILCFTQADRYRMLWHCPLVSSIRKHNIHSILIIWIFFLVLLAINYWLERNNFLFISLSAVAIIIFRADVAVLLGLFLIYDLYYKRTSFAEWVPKVSLYFIQESVRELLLFFQHAIDYQSSESIYFNWHLAATSSF